MKPLTAISLIAVALAAAQAAFGQGTSPAEPLLRELPAGIAVESCQEVPAAQAEAIGRKLGGAIARLTNSRLRVHGRPIQVNVIEAVDEANAKAVHATLSKLKAAPFCTRKGTLVVEYVGRDLDAALATKTSCELGVVEKPSQVRYRVVAKIAPVEKPDPAVCEAVLDQFVALGDGADPQAVQRIRDLAKKLAFGRVVSLRNPKLDGGATTHSLVPAPSESKEIGPTVAYSFGELPERYGIPFVTATVDVAVDQTGFRDGGPAADGTAATKFWPADDPAIVELARTITAGKATSDAKATAILEWLAPGRNLKYSGQAGSRFGTRAVLEQKFGRCHDFSDCFVTLARAAGVPSRQVAGWLYGSSGHVWAEFYREGKGWQQVDPTGGGTLACGIWHIPSFTTEDGEMPILYLGSPEIEIVEMKP